LLARPVFAKSRRPFEAPAPEAPVKAEAGVAAVVTPAGPPPDPSEFSLNAVFATGDRKMALLTSRATPDGKWLNVGDAIGAWRIAAIDSDAVEIQSGAYTFRVKLYTDILR
jgi:hypothetical protein